jgi:Family of unknown function (DUF5329)
MIRTIAMSMIVLMFSLAGSVLHAATPTEQEIRHLLNFIASSDCTFIRNGTAYPSKEAGAHIERKYDYVQSKVKTAEDFIRLAATQSSQSGDPYRINCAGKEILSKDWLLTELGRYREKASQPDKNR